MGRTRSAASRALAAACALLAAAQGCATAARPERPLTPAEERMRAQAADFHRTVGEGVAAGALLGAMLGAATGAAVKGKKRGEGAAIGAAIGALAGGVAGGAAGAYYADKKRQYASAEMRLDAIIAELRQQNASLAALVESTRAVAADDRERLAAIERDLAAHRISRAQADRQLADIDANIRFLEQTVANLKRHEADWKEVAAHAIVDTGPMRMRELEAEIRRMEEQIRLMENELNALTSRRASVVG